MPPGIAGVEEDVITGKMIGHGPAGLEQARCGQHLQQGPCDEHARGFQPPDGTRDEIEESKANEPERTQDEEVAALIHIKSLL